LAWTGGTALGGLLWRRLTLRRGYTAALVFVAATAWLTAAGVLAPRAASPAAAATALLLLVLPPALLAGTLFPAGLARVPSAASALFWDGLGAAAALAAFAGFSIGFGHRAALAAALAAYAWALTRRP
jgi:hypothetical protein